MQRGEQFGCRGYSVRSNDWFYGKQFERGGMGMY
jgi:hypothetical protein